MSGVINSTVAKALQTLAATNVALQKTGTEVATGKVVATVEDDPAAYVVALRLASDAQVWAAVQSGLGGAATPARVANAAMDSITDTLTKLKSTAIEAQSGGDFTSADATQIQSLLSQLTGYESDSTVNGVNLIAGAVVNDVTTTQISTPRSIDGGMVTIGDRGGISQMNASVPGLGLDGFNGTTDGIQLSFTSLDVQNISTTPPATQVEAQTANYNNTNSRPVESPQYPGQSWTFVFTDASSPAPSTTLNGPPDAAGNITHSDHTIPVPLPPGFTLDDAINGLQTAMRSVKFETKFVANAPSGPTLSVAGNNIGLSTSVPNLRPKLPPPVFTMHGDRTQTIVTGSTRIDFDHIFIDLPPSGNMSDCVGATYLQNQAGVDAYMAGPHTTPAFYLTPFSASIPAGTTITGVDPNNGYFDISSPATANIPVPVLIGNWHALNVLMPNPTIPTTSTATWGGAEGAIATLNSAMSKTGDMAQNLGNALNTLQAAQDHASQQIDVIDSGMGNLVDADLGKVAAQMQALQIRQQLAIQTIGLDNQRSQLILQLFK